MRPSPYVLVTPAKNEAASIGETIASVLSQSVRPEEWIIVDDGSTDQTREIVHAAAKENPWIRLLVSPPRADRCFRSVVHATEAGIRAIRSTDYCYLGLLDSDVRFQRDYFERLMAHFESSPRLGLAGGVVIDVGLPRDRLPRNRQDVPGAVQFFRRSCFEQIGGLIAIPQGGWDGLTCASARMRGFETKLMTELVVDHLKPRNISQGSVLRRIWQLGVRDCALGYDPLFELLKCLSRLSAPPYFIGSVAWFAGYCCASLAHPKRLVSNELLAFIRFEQKTRVRAGFKRFYARGGSRTATRRD